MAPNMAPLSGSKHPNKMSGGTIWRSLDQFAYLTKADTESVRAWNKRKGKKKW